MSKFTKSVVELFKLLASLALLWFAIYYFVFAITSIVGFPIVTKGTYAGKTSVWFWMYAIPTSVFALGGIFLFLKASGKFPVLPNIIGYWLLALISAPLFLLALGWFVGNSNVLFQISDVWLQTYLFSAVAGVLFGAIKFRASLKAMPDN